MRLTMLWIAVVGLLLSPAASTFGGSSVPRAPVDEGIDCSCSRVGPYINPDPGQTPSIGADGLSPGGIYRLTVSGPGPLELTITRVATGQTVVRLYVPVNSAWGFSPDDHRFVYHYVTSPVHNVFLHDLQASNPAVAVRTFAVATDTARIIFSPRGHNLLYAAITAPSYTTMYIVDARTGTTRFQTAFTFQTPPGSPGDEFGVAAWGWSPDLPDRTFVYAYVSGPSSVEFFLANLHASPAQVYSETILSRSAFWQFSPCGDVLGLVRQPNPSQIGIRLFRTINGQRVTSSQETFSLAPVQMRTTSASHIATVDGVDYVFAPNTASQTCPPPATLTRLAVSPTIMPGGGSATGTVTLSGAAPTGGLAVGLSSDNAAAQVPASVTVPQGQTRQNFPINTSTVTTTVTARITAVRGTVTRSADLTLVPQASFCPATTSTTWQFGVWGEALSVAMDALGNVVAAGSLFNPSGALFAVFNLDGTSSAELWRQTITGTSLQPSDEVDSVVLDPAGDVVAAGYVTNTGRIDFAVAKFDGRTGAVLWEQEIRGTRPNGWGFARAVSVDGTGNVVAVGHIVNIDTGDDFTVAKFDGVTGAELWRQVIDGTAHRNDDANAVAVDGTGNVFAAGVLLNVGFSQSFTVIKFDGATGAELWRREITPASTFGSDRGWAVEVDGAGNVVAAGSLAELDVGRGMAVIKFEGISGNELWRQVIYGSGGGYFDRANAVKVDRADDVVVGGYINNAGTNDDFTVAKLDGASGAERWRQIINGTANGDDRVLSVALDGVGDVVAAGHTQNTGTNFTVIKFDGASGAVPWCRVITGTAPGANGIAWSVTVDGLGNAVAAGRIPTAANPYNFTVVKFRGTGGGDL